jgi:hypothetical protein
MEMSLTRDDWLSLQSASPSAQSLNTLLASCHAQQNLASDREPCDVIVGGGLAGLLTALKLSRQRPGRESSIVLLESRSTLGGRPFQSPPSHPGQSRVEALAAQFATDALQQSSGPGFELFDPVALDVFERHVRMNLSEDEIDFIDGFVKERSQSAAAGKGPAVGSAGDELERNTFLVRKEMTPLSDVLSGSSEMLTRKEAETLMALSTNGVTDGAQNASHALQNDSKSEADGPLESSRFWTALPKVQKEALTPLLDTLLGWPLDRTPASVVQSTVQAFVKSHRSILSPWMARRSRLELALEVVLLARGVRVHTQAELVRAFAPEKKGDYSRIQVAELHSKSPVQLTVRSLAFAIPLMKTLSVLAREQLHPQHSRLVARHRPRSVVWVEYDDWRQAVVSAQFNDQLQPGGRLVCPVERVQGLCLSHGRLGFYTSIDFEDSLHAQSVREALNRCRKAALRLLSEPHMKAAQQARPAAPGIRLMRERIGLWPVGFNLPRHEPLPAISEIKMAPAGWYSLGDHFTFGPESWRNLIDSVHETVQSMN